MQGGHHVAQKFTTIRFLVPLRRRAFRSGAPTSCKFTGAVLQGGLSPPAHPAWSDSHFIGQPADTRGLDGHGLACEQRVDRIARVACLHLVLAQVVVDASLVPKRALLIEDEDLWCRDDLECRRGGLRVAVVEVRVLEMPISGARLHVSQGVGEVGVRQFFQCDGLRTIGVDRHDRDTPLPIVGVQLLDPLFVELGDRAVIAREDHRQHGTRGVVGQCVGLAIDAGQRKCRRRRANRQRRRWRHAASASQRGRDAETSNRSAEHQYLLSQMLFTGRDDVVRTFTSNFHSRSETLPLCQARWVVPARRSCAQRRLVPLSETDSFAWSPPVCPYRPVEDDGDPTTNSMELVVAWMVPSQSGSRDGCRSWRNRDRAPVSCRPMS